MATFTLEVPDSEVSFFTKLIEYLSFVRILSVENSSEAASGFAQEGERPAE